MARDCLPPPCLPMIMSALIQDAMRLGLQAAAAYLGAVYRFSRPHTIIGTFISVCSVSALALVHPPPLLPNLCIWVCGSGL